MSPPTLAVHSVLAADASRPPIVLVHGAANSAIVWSYWQPALAERGWSSHAIDLRGHGRSEPVDLSSTAMADYAGDVARAARTLRAAPVVIGWSMGGLAGLMAAAACGARAWIGLAPSMPAPARRPSAVLRRGVFGPEEYGITGRDAADQPAMPDLDRDERVVALASLGLESRLARDERSAGVVVDVPARPLLILTGTADTFWPTKRYDTLHVHADRVEIDGASHWGLVLNRRVVPVMVEHVTTWLARVGVS